MILETLYCGLPINLKKCASYAEKSAILYLGHYNWYYMPVTVLKVLFHSMQIIKTLIIPFGQMSEEAQKVRNKDIRRYRENFTRKSSRVNTNKIITII